MNASMIIAAVGMRASQQALDVAAHNIANANTVGFKRREASFEDVLAQVYEQPPGFRLPGRLTPLGLPYGWGANVHQLALDFRQGPIADTGRELDFAIEGDGLFEVSVAGVPLWTRAGAFEWAIDPDDPAMKVLTTPDGAYVLAEGGERISVRSGSGLRVDAEGRLYEVSADGTVVDELGRLAVVRVVRPQLLVNVGDNRFALAEGAAEADAIDRDNVWTVGGAGSPIRVRQRALEQSNVRPADEMVGALAAQRAFQLQARAFATAEQMLGLAVSMRG